MNRRIFITSVAACALAPKAASAQSIDFFPFLGESDLTAPDKFTRRYGIRYNARGFDAGRTKRIERKTPNYLIKKNAAHLVEPFQVVAYAMTSDANIIAEAIDEAFDAIYQRWFECGGVFMDTAVRFDPRRLYVQFEDVPFWMPEYAAYKLGTTDGRNIRVVNVTAERLFSDPQNAGIRYWEPLVEWEIGNSFMLASRLPWTPENEIGFRYPCEARVAEGLRHSSLMQI